LVQCDVTRPNNILTTNSIQDALVSTTPCRLEAVVVDENEEVNFVQNEQPRRYKLYIIADNTGTSPLLVYDDLIEKIKLTETFIFTQIKCKKIHGKVILSTYGNSTISKTTNVIQDLEKTFS
jgi:hypothetical protein